MLKGTYSFWSSIFRDILVHFSKTVQTLILQVLLCTKRLQVLDWPACSPNLFHIENDFRIMKSKIRQYINQYFQCFECPQFPNTYWMWLKVKVTDIRLSELFLKVLKVWLPEWVYISKRYNSIEDKSEHSYHIIAFCFLCFTKCSMFCRIWFVPHGEYMTPLYNITELNGTVNCVCNYIISRCIPPCSRCTMYTSWIKLTRTFSALLITAIDSKYEIVWMPIFFFLRRSK